MLFVSLWNDLFNDNIKQNDIYNIYIIDLIYKYKAVNNII